MSAVSLSVEPNSKVSSASDDRERRFTALYQESGFTDVSDPAFTVLQTQTDENFHSTDQPLDLGDQEGNETENIKGKRKAYSKFSTSFGDQKTLNRSNAYLLQQKLLDLSKSNRSLHNQKVQNKSQNLSKVINILREQKTVSKLNGHLPQQEKLHHNKDISKPFNNLQQHNINQNEKSTEKEHKNYHRYCRLSGSNYKYDMTSVKPISTYDKEFPTLTDARMQKNEMGTDRRKSPPEADPYMKVNANNNNIDGTKNMHYHGNNYTKNGYTNNIRRNEKNINNDENRKPLFITTVKTGKFLDPPPELAILLGLSRKLDGSVTSSTDGSSNSLDTSTRDRHQQQVLLYSFSSQPRVLHQHYHRAKCDAAAKAANSTQPKVLKETTKSSDVQDKADNGPLPYGNIMFDRRIVRGSNYAQHPMPTEGEESPAARQQEARRRAMARRRAQGQQTRNARLRMHTPPPVAGRKHETVQTERYLEEILNRPPESDASCQTDLFLDRPDSPVYVPATVGLDVETQIYPGDLFEFDFEVEPILEVLVGKTVEYALTEVLEEEELEGLRAQQRRFRELRASEQAELQRLEEQDRRLPEDKVSSAEQSNESTKQQKDMEERVNASVITEEHLAEMVPPVVEGLRDAGYFIDDIKIGTEEGFMPWLLSEVKQEIKQMISSREILTDIVREILETRAELYRVMGEDDAKELGLDSEEEEIPKQSDKEPVQEAESEGVVNDTEKIK